MKNAKGMDRRRFLKTAGVGAAATVGAGGILATPASSLAASTSSTLSAPGVLTRRSETRVAVVGAGAFGGWTALRLQEMGFQVTVVDLYGPGNSRAPSGDETRGIRTSYGGRDLWTSWAHRAIQRWRDFDAQFAPDPDEHVFYNTGDLILRPDWTDQMTEVQETWERNGIPFEVLTPDEVAYRWPQLRTEGVGAVLYEPGAGVARARAAIRRVSLRFREAGGQVVTALAEPGRQQSGRLLDLCLQPGDALEADLFIFALGPWFPKAFPDLMAQRIRLFMGHVYYFGTPPGDTRFSHPHLPSYGIPGATGWPAIPPDYRGFRIRTGGRGSDDPDEASRHIPEEYHEQAIELLGEYFPALHQQPIVETRACHYESSVTRNWIIDRHPGYENVWLAGGGSAEGFKFGPVLGDLIAGRAVGQDAHPELSDEFRIRDEDLAPGGQGA
ncbi:MAG: FAD-dependent oxidoreductase [Gemmatimonadota bacterium]